MLFEERWVLLMYYINIHHLLAGTSNILYNSLMLDLNLWFMSKKIKTFFLFTQCDQCSCVSWIFWLCSSRFTKKRKWPLHRDADKSHLRTILKSVNWSYLKPVFVFCLWFSWEFNHNRTCWLFFCCATFLWFLMEKFF